MGSQTKHYDLSEDKLFYISHGILSKVICVPASWDQEKIARQVNEDGLPAGSDSNLRWVISTPPGRGEGPLDGGNNRPCNERSNRIHWLLNC